VKPWRQNSGTRIKSRPRWGQKLTPARLAAETIQEEGTIYEAMAGEGTQARGEGGGEPEKGRGGARPYKFKSEISPAVEKSHRLKLGRVRMSLVAVGASFDYTHVRRELKKTKLAHSRDERMA